VRGRKEEGMDKLNRLERSILAAEDSAEDARWLQAEEIVRRLGRGETKREVAVSWINGRTGKPYSQEHVSRVASIWVKYGPVNPGLRPTFSNAYAEVKGYDSSEQAKAQAPDSVEAAKKLGANLAKHDPEILSAVLEGYDEAIEEEEPERKEKKKRRSLSDDWTAWLTKANTVMVNGARLEDRTEAVGEPLDGSAEGARFVYHRLTERKLDAEIRELLESEEVG
jgi:hypothetical protein